jgi:hypothetical protein
VIQNSPEALALLDGVIDIYMPDMKYGDSVIAHRYSHVRNYREVDRAAAKEMHRQVGNRRLDENGLAHQGLLVRHFVFPAGLAGTEKVLEFIAREIFTEAYLNLGPNLAGPATAPWILTLIRVAGRNASSDFFGASSGLYCTSFYQPFDYRTSP